VAQCLIALQSAAEFPDKINKQFVLMGPPSLPTSRDAIPTNASTLRKEPLVGVMESWLGAKSKGQSADIIIVQRRVLKQDKDRVMTIVP